MAIELLYVHDPMCSWCWAFRPAFASLRAQLPRELRLRKVVGGLAPDNDQPMPERSFGKLLWRYRRTEFHHQRGARILACHLRGDVPDQRLNARVKVAVSA